MVRKPEPGNLPQLPSTRYRRRAWLDFQRALDPLAKPHPLPMPKPHDRAD